MTRNRLLLVKTYEGTVLPALPQCLYTSLYNLARMARMWPAKAFTLVDSIAKVYLDYFLGRVGGPITYPWWPRPKLRARAMSAR